MGGYPEESFTKSIYQIMARVNEVVAERSENKYGLCCERAFVAALKSPFTSSIVQIIFLFRSFEISKDIQSVKNTHV